MKRRKRGQDRAAPEEKREHHQALAVEDGRRRKGRQAGERLRPGRSVKEAPAALLRKNLDQVGFSTGAIRASAKEGLGVLV